MGAGQSNANGGAAGGGGEVKTSYYELLGVERTASQDELKKAYRKKALELHPDRNHGDTERTTALFAEIQSAYEVLSDDQERAWYDAHEGDILRGGSGEGASEDHYQGNMRMTTSDELARMMGKFRGNIDFSDSPTGFFGYVRETFEQLAKEEEYAADYEDIPTPVYPTFGHKGDTYDGVVRDFYSAWNSFATAKTFSWLDEYRLSEAPDRRIRRAMEKENQKLRDDGRREFNDAVRTLVAFVRKRDPRYTPSTQSADEKAKAQRDARKAQAAKARAAQLAKLEQEAQALPSWATARPADEEAESTEEEVEEEHYECVACNKTFKSERQYEAHEKSKKHQKAIQSLKRKMQKDNAHLDLDGDALSSGVVTPAPVDEEDLASDTNGADAYTEAVTEQAETLNIHDSRTEDEDNDIPTAPQPSHDTPTPSSPSSPSSSDEYASPATIHARLTSTSSSPTPDPALPKLGKAALKRAKRAAKHVESVHAHTCLACNAAFPSNSRLHQHLQEEPGHAVGKVGVGGGRGKGGKKGRR